MNKLVSDLLDLAKLEQVANKEIYSIIDLSKIIEMQVLSFESLAFEQNLSLKYEIEKEIYFNQKADQVKKDLDSSMPLEKSRFLVSYISSTIAKGINEYLKTLSSEKRFELAVSLLNQFSNLVSDRTFDAAVYGFDPAYVKSTLSSKVKINSCSSVDFAKSGSEAVDGIEIHEGVILLSEDKSVKIRLTLEEVITELIDKYRKELAVTLFGGRLPE